MTPPVKTCTVEEFDAFVELPENLDKNFEYIGEEIVEVPSNPFASKVSSISIKGKVLGHLTGEAGGYQVSGELAAGTTVWIAYPLTKKVEVCEPGKPVVIDTLDGGTILPGFKLAVKDVFPE